MANDLGRRGAPGRGQGPGAVNATLACLVRLVLDETWSASVAASRLVEHSAGDPGVLRMARARILRASEGILTPVERRALTTLDLAYRRANRLR